MDEYLDEAIKFPCPKDGEYTTFRHCESSTSQCCDIYQFMMDEDFD